MLRGRRVLSCCVVNRRALHNHGRLLVTRKMCDWGLVDSTSSVDVNCVDDLIYCLCCLLQSLLLCLVLTGRCEKETSIGSEGQASKEGLQGIIGVDARILDPKANIVWLW